MNDLPASDELPAGWYPDLDRSGIERYWAGASWTNKTRPIRPDLPLRQLVTAVVVGVAVCLFTWAVSVPWDLSEYDEAGNRIAGGGDDNAGAIAGVVLVLLLVGLVAVYRAPRLGRIAAIASFATWAILFAWRASVSRVAGANLWPVSFVMFIIPAVIVASTIVTVVERRIAIRRIDTMPGATHAS